MIDKPLVSIMVPNYNYGHFLHDCLESAVNQTYENTEIIVLDNCSTDNSLEVINDFKSSKIRVCKNSVNIMNMSYRFLSERLAYGKYAMLLCSDDMIEPSFVEKAVYIMENNPNVGYVHGERSFITDVGDEYELSPFFNCSFIAPGKNVMPIYMVTTIAHPSQGIFRMSVFNSIGGYDKKIDHMNADKCLWYYMSFESDYAYIREKMAKIRIGSQTDTHLVQRNFQHPILCHLTIQDFINFAEHHDLKDVLCRRDEAFARLAHENMTNAYYAVKQEEYELAQKYLSFGYMQYRMIADSTEYKRIVRAIDDENPNIELETLRAVDVKKIRNYEPPKGYISIEV